jgi:uncharacterized surface protein with fasciclin (FAS1) repeats
MKVTRPVSLIAVVASATLVLAGCGTDTDDATTETPVATSEEFVEEEFDMDLMPELSGTIVDVASTTEGFGTLVTALGRADLVETLNSEGPFTVFAPTDAAFDALPPGLLDALLLPENKDTLVKILTYHVVPGDLMSSFIVDGELATVEGQNVTLSTMDGVTVNGAQIIQADVVASNGVIHAIDAVLLPPDVDPAALLGE